MSNLPERSLDVKTSTARKTILYVEDDRYSQILVEQILNKNYDVKIAPRAEDALRMVTDSHYDLILMDIKLGYGKSGIDITREIRAMSHYKEVPILAVTAMAFPNDRKYMISQGCTDTITKPLDFGLFKMKIAELLKKEQNSEIP